MGYTKGKWQMVFVKGFTPGCKIMSEAVTKKGYSDWICEMPFSSEDEMEEMGQENIDNARLICYAPELLAELKRVRELLDETRDYDEDVKKIDHLIRCASQK